MTTRTILALDPGGTTGWALWRSEVWGSVDDEGEAFYGEQWNRGEIGPHQHHDDLFTLLESHQTYDYTIVCESFQFRQDAQQPKIEYTSLEYIGVVNLYCQTHPVKLVMQSPMTVMGPSAFWTDNKLKKIGKFPRGMKDARAATKHLLYYMSFTLKMQQLFNLLKES